MEAFTLAALRCLIIPGSILFGGMALQDDAAALTSGYVNQISAQIGAGIPGFALPKTDHPGAKFIRP
jgi:hypothetical protein